MGVQADSPVLVYVWAAMQSRNRELCSSCRIIQKQVFSLWKAKTWGYVRPWFFFQFHEWPKKFCSCRPLPGLSMVACTESAQDLTTFVLRHSDLNSQSAFSKGVSCFTSRVLFCTGCDRMSPITHAVCHAVLRGAVLPGWAGGDRTIIQETSLFQSVSIMSQWCPVALTCWCFSQGLLWS